MKRIYGLILAVVAGIACFSTAWAAENEAVVNVATYNIRLLHDGDAAAGNGWERRNPVIAQLIRFHEFEIFGTQEGYKRQLEDLKAQLPGYEYTGVARDDGKEGGEHSAIFYDTEKFELLDHGDFWLSESPERPGLGWDAACNRICSWGKFRHKPSGKIFQFYNLHLDHVGEVARIESVKLVQQKMKENGLELPTFLTGDFNVDQNNELYGVLTASGFLNDSFHRAPIVYATNGTYNAYQTDGFTESRIDHILVTDNITVDKYGILTDTYRTPVEDSSGLAQGDKPAEIEVVKYQSRVPSDHFPVMIRARF